MQMTILHWEGITSCTAAYLGLFIFKEKHEYFIHSSFTRAFLCQNPESPCEFKKYIRNCH